MNRLKNFRIFLLCSLSFPLCQLMIWNNNKISFKEFVNTFVNTYGKLNIPQIAYDYKDYFKSISSEIELKNQELFFQTQQKSLKSYKKSSLKNKEKLDYEQLNFEIEFNLQRLALEKAWVLEGRNIPEDGLFSLNNHKEWYQYFIKKFTSLDLSPEQIMDLGKTEVKRVKEEIRKIQIESGYLDSASFYKYLKSDAFYITDKKQLIKLFENTDITIRKNLNNFINIPVLPIIYPIEWPESGQNTPPGMYLNHTNNTFGKDVFQFNFFGGRYNKRAIEWLYMHEGIPGHHLQFSLRESDIPNSLQELFLYPGNFEGWACYVEYQGKDLGIFKDIYSYLGKWEWDLVRSARLVIDAGIHNFGWTRQQALEYWKQNIPGQDEIAEREVTRVTNWTAQALSYKVGAECIQKLKEKLMHKYGSDFNIQKFHKCYLSFGLRPLSVIQEDFITAYSLVN